MIDNNLSPCFFAFRIKLNVKIRKCLFFYLKKINKFFNIFIKNNTKEVLVEIPIDSY
jgi:hypothetical protein